MENTDSPREYHHASGCVDYINWNRHSTHPNPWRQPNCKQQWSQTGQNDYQIYKTPHIEKQWRDDPSLNPLTEDGGGPLSNRIGRWAYRGFIVGLGMGLADIWFYTQSQNPRVHMTRLMYIVPPVTVMPVSFVVAREMMSKMDSRGDLALWPWFWAAAAPAAIWGNFRNNDFQAK